MFYEAACGSNTGAFRSENEDNLFFGGRILPETHGSIETMSGRLELDGETGRGFSVAVFDGMGGQADGQVASHLAAETFQRCLKLGRRAGDLPRFLAASVQAMNEAVSLYARHVNARAGTTAVILCFFGESFTVCNVGDSRAFLLREGLLRQLSADHTDAAALAALGVHGRKPRLTQYIGMYQEELLPEPFLAEEPVMEGDLFLLCSDGVTDVLGGPELCALLAEPRPLRDRADALIEAALRRGSRDNITVILVQAGAGAGTTKEEAEA